MTAEQILAVESETALRLNFSTSQPQSRVSPVHPGTHPVTRQQPTQDLAGATPTIYLVIGLLSGDPYMDPKADPCPSPTLLNKVLQVVTSTRGLEGIHTSIRPSIKPTNHRCYCRPSKSLKTGSNAAQLQLWK